MTDPELTASHAPRRVAFHGEFGAFGEAAVTVLWPDATAVPTRAIADVLRSVSRGEVDAGVLPVENTVAGGVMAAFDALAGAPELHAVAEAVLRVRQCLLAVPGATLDGIRVVESHPVALSQCSAFLARLSDIREQAASDTAGAARAVAESGDRTRAAIASRHAAARYGLTILAEDVEDRPDNQTRFLAVARRPAMIPPLTPARTTLIFTTANEPGALIRALDPIADHGLNLSRLESRPTGEPWTYRFFADVDHVAGEKRVTAMLAAVTRTTQTFRILGTYARGETRA